MFLKQSPVVRLLLPFILGIAVMLSFSFCFYYAGALFIVVFAINIFFQSVHSFSASYKWRWVSGMLINVVFFLMGTIITWLHTGLNNTLHFGNFNGNTYLAFIEEPPVYKEKSIKIVATVHCMQEGRRFYETNGKLIIYLPNNNKVDLTYGDYFVFTGKPKQIEPPKNPEEFNYARYLAFHNIYHQVYLKEKSFQKTGVNNANWVYSASYYLRDYLIEILKTTIPDKKIYSVGSALLVGYDDDLEDTLMTAYASSGVLHVLSVSGMHVAIIFKMLEWLLGILLKIKRGKHLYYVLIIMVLWFYAFLTGLCPSVLRATMMLTFVVIGKWSGRNTGILNTLMVSCFFLLIYNPFLLVDAGFQLSFLAVIGIVILHPMLFRHFQPRNKVLLAIWSVVSISLCAQLITFPISLFYFHQFPNLFLVANLLIIPATTAAIYSCIALVVFYKIPFLGIAIAKCTYACIWFSNATVELVGAIPCAVTNGISITMIEMALLYIIILMLIFYLAQKRWIYLTCLLILTIIFQCLQGMENISQSKQNIMAVYSLKGHSAICFISGRKCFMITDKALLSDEKTKMFHLQQHWWKLGVTKPVVLSESYHDTGLFKKDHFVQFNGKKILVLDSAYCIKLNNRIDQQLMNIDYLMLTGNAPISLHKINKFIHVKQLIIDESNNYSKTMRWKREARALKINCFSTKESGAFICKM